MDIIDFATVLGEPGFNHLCLLGRVNNPVGDGSKLFLHATISLCGDARCRFEQFQICVEAASVDGEVDLPKLLFGGNQRRHSAAHRALDDDILCAIGCELLQQVVGNWFASFIELVNFDNERLACRVFSFGKLERLGGIL